MDSHHINCTGTLHVLIAARDAGVERLILSSSCSVYGNDPTLPKTEGAPVSPMSPYALSKRINEEQCGMFHRLYGLPVCILRYFNAYGPGQCTDSPFGAVIPRFCRALLAGDPLTVVGDGKQTRDFVYVEDISRANLAACMGPEESVGRIFNIGSGRSFSILELAEMVQSVAGVSTGYDPAPERRGEVRHSRADITSAKDLLRLEPGMDFKTGIRTTLDWHKLNMGNLEVV